MKAGWETKPLGEAAEIVNGGTPKSKVTEYWSGDVQWLTPKDMGQMAGREIGETPRTISESGLARSSARLVPERSVILSTRAPIGHLAINTSPMAFNQGCRGLVPKPGLDHVYLYYFLLLNRERLNELGSGTTFKELSAGNLKSLPIPLPPLEEQQRIVAVLDEAFEGLDRARENAEANLENAQELFESYRENVLSEGQEGWIAAPLSRLITVKHGFAFKSEFFTDEGEYVLLTPGNYWEHGGYRDRGSKQKYYDGDIPDGFILAAGDLLMAMTEQAVGLLGSSMIVPADGKFLHNQRLGLIKPMPGTVWCTEFFTEVFNLRKFRAALQESASGVKVRHTSPKKIGEVTVCFPNKMADQQEIATLLRDIRQLTAVLETNVQKKLADLDDLRQSLLRKAFAGELT